MNELANKDTNIKEYRERLKSDRTRSAIDAPDLKQERSAKMSGRSAQCMLGESQLVTSKEPIAVRALEHENHLMYSPDAACRLALDPQPIG
jgi:hypothetical protein